MRRAVVAGGILGVITGLLFVYHDALRLSAAWPVVAGLALWGAVGHRGARALPVAAGAAVGAGAGYLAYVAVAEYFPITRFWLGVTTGVGVGVVVLAAVWMRERVPVVAPLVGFAVFAGLFEPLWAESPAAVRTHGIETLTVAMLALVVGVIGVWVGRVIADRIEEPSPEARVRRRDDDEETVPAGELFGRSS